MFKAVNILYGRWQVYKEGKGIFNYCLCLVKPVKSVVKHIKGNESFDVFINI